MLYRVALACGFLGLFAGTIAHAADTEAVLCQQFSIPGATKTVAAATSLDGVFSTAHHAPRNIPIEVKLPGSGEAYIHFPIVEAGQYLILATDPGRLAAVELKGDASVGTSDVEAPESCAATLEGGLSVDLSDDKVTGPTPVAIKFAAGPAEALRLIISRDPIN